MVTAVSETPSIREKTMAITAMTTTTTTPPLLAALLRDGFVKIPNLIRPPLLGKLHEACRKQTEEARAGNWPYVRTVPKQYPPWPVIWPPGIPGDGEGDGTGATGVVGDLNIWGVQHLLHPEMPDRETFAEAYFCDEILDVVAELVGLRGRDDDDDGGGGGEDKNDQLVMELFNLLVSPSASRDFELCWHRDDIKPEVSAEEERAQLAAASPGGRQLHAQYNLALCEDSSLVVVPGSHLRPRTEEERLASLGAGTSSYSLPPKLSGQIVVKLKPGDAVFYNSNILHRGVYEGIDVPRGDLGRMTLHGSVGLAGHGTARARQVLQHAVGDWVDRAQFAGLPDPQRQRAEAMRKRLVAMGTGDGLGYSLDG